MISISDLMQISHPGHRHYVSSYNLHDTDLPLFLDYCVNVVDRFNHYSMMNFKRGLDNTECIFKILQDTDEPRDVFEIREKLMKELSNFEFLCDSMARCFVSPSFVKEFYEGLSSRLKNEISVYAGVEA